MRINRPFALLFVLLSACASTRGAENIERKQVVLPDGSPFRGPEHAKVTVIEFLDYDCPPCLKAEGTIEAIESSYPGRVRFGVVEAPSHPAAKLAALAAIAAGHQGRFFEMHRLLLASAKLEREDLLKAAAALSLDLDRFATDLDAPETSAELSQHTVAAEQYATGTTPSFLVNGRPCQGAESFTELKRLIDEELEANPDVPVRAYRDRSHGRG
jgi:protein-disulfide isomerase